MPSSGSSIIWWPHFGQRMKWRSLRRSSSAVFSFARRSASRFSRAWRAVSRSSFSFWRNQSSSRRRSSSNRPPWKPVRASLAHPRSGVSIGPGADDTHVNMLTLRAIRPWRRSGNKRPGGPLADAFPISGSIDPKAFPYLLMDLHRNGATGSLKVEGPSYQKALYFRSGRILFGSSNDPRDQLGAILIQTGKITPEQLEDVTAKVGPGNPLAKALADTGYVSQRELSDAARAKVESILSDVIAYTAGNFEFEDGVLPKGAIDLKLPTERLVLSSVRRLSDRNFVLRHLDGLEVVLIPGPDLVPKLAELQPDGGGLPEQLDGKRTLKEAAGLTRLDE